MNQRVKLMLFCSAYSPLFIILSIIYFNFNQLNNIFNFIKSISLNQFNSTNITSINKLFSTIEFNLDILISIFLFLFALTFIILFYFYFISTGGGSNHFIKIKSADNKTHDFLNYLLPYMLSFLSTDIFNLTQIKGVLLFLIIMGLIYAIYTNSNLIFFNPLLILFNIKFYEVIDDKNNNLIVISKETINYNNKYIRTKKISENLYKEV